MPMSDEKILKAIKNKVKGIAPDAMAILFGSHARGDAKPGSDWDILIILDKPKIGSSDYDSISFPLYELGWEIGEHFSTKLYSKSDWLKRSITPFYKNIEKEGLIL